MEVVEVWTGRLANLLRTAFRLTNEGFAGELGTAVRTVARWNAEPERVPVAELQRALDTMLNRAPTDVRSRFTHLVEEHRAATHLPHQRRVPDLDDEARAAEFRLAQDANISDVLAWLDKHAEWTPGSARRRVATLLSGLNLATIRDRAEVRATVTQSEIADALSRYYKPTGDIDMYRADCEGVDIRTTILTRPDWLDLRLPLGAGRDHLRLAFDPAPPIERLDTVTAEAAATKLAEVVMSSALMVNAPLYRLRRLDVSDQCLTGEVAVTDFLTYALTLDLLENELLDAIAERTTDRFDLPLRDRHLPDIETIIDMAGRVCAGGPLALFAAARPRRRGQSADPDYVLLVQDRSGRTLNAGRRLAVIPKAFHQPLVDLSHDAQLSVTIEREMEEELFGRPDMGLTSTGCAASRQADPLHLSRLSSPMRWLIDNADTDRWQLECTGFGLNLVSGNFEAACLVVIHDEQWWNEFGGSIEANWEVEGVRRYSTQDTGGLTRLVHDASWTNEGLFAFVQGLRRLAEIGRSRVNLPTITLET